MHFVRTFSIMRAIVVRLIVIEKVQNYGKLYSLKTQLKTAGEGVHTPYPTTMDPPLAISYTNHQKSLAYFSYLAPFALLY